jgi:5-methylcytosine-specific restriction endonuclease McrA
MTSNATSNPVTILELAGQKPKHPYRKKSIPAAVRQQVWLTYVGEHFKSKCKVRWCRNTITVFQFDCGHNVPESRGGTTTIDNLLPICSNCNGSMREHYTIDEWSAAFAPKKKNFFSMCLGKSTSADSAAVAPQK